MNISSEFDGAGAKSGVPYVYVIVRKDITFEQQMVQSSHASLEAGCRYKPELDVAHLVMLEVGNESALLDASCFLRETSVDHHIFYEPDDDMGFSALATGPLYGSARSVMKKFKLFRCHSSGLHVSADSERGKKDGR